VKKGLLNERLTYRKKIGKCLDKAGCDGVKRRGEGGKKSTRSLFTVQKRRRTRVEKEDSGGGNKCPQARASGGGNDLARVRSTAHSRIGQASAVEAGPESDPETVRRQKTQEQIKRLNKAHRRTVPRSEDVDVDANEGQQKTLKRLDEAKGRPGSAAGEVKRRKNNE